MGTHTDRPGGVVKFLEIAGSPVSFSESRRLRPACRPFSACFLPPMVAVMMDTARVTPSPWGTGNPIRHPTANRGTGDSGT